ncbi:MAG: hypothetical protein JXP34_01760 [Planctomycetes bacterium]|nr:hypothetical protein [Planctomycetota bacterium]
MNSRALFVLATAVSFACVPAFAQMDPFDEDPVTSGDWELHEPVTGSSYSLEDGWWRVTLRAGINLDSWTTIDQALKLRRADLPADFAIETRVRFLGSGDPDDPTWPPADEAYLASLMVQFSTFDLFHWGPYRGTLLRLERSGVNDLCRVDPTLQEVSLQIKKVGSTYSFSYRATDDDAWIHVCNQTVDETLFPPEYVGIIFKTWSPATTVDETFEFDYFNLEEIVCEAPVIQDIQPDPLPAFPGMPFRLQMELAGGSAPITWSRAQPAGATIDPDTGLLEWTPAEGDVGKTIDFEIAAQNGCPNGKAVETFRVVVKPYPFIDPFDGDALESGWEWHAPFDSPTGDLTGSGFFEITVPNSATAGDSFDTWTTVDRAPKLRLRYAPDGDFAVETRVELIEPPGTPANYLASLWIQFDNPAQAYDGIHFGFLCRSTLPNSNTLRVERVGHLSPAGPEPTVVDDPLASFRVERRGDEYRFLYRQEAGDEWILHHTMTIPGIPVTHVGLIVKTWGTGTVDVIADFDYFSVGPLAEMAPSIALPCDFGDPDIAWLGMPYVRPVEVDGIPFPEVRPTFGPPEIEYDRTSRTIAGWTPSAIGAVALELEASNGSGTASESWTAEVFADPVANDEDFDEDPRDDGGFWLFAEPQEGVAHSIIERDGTNWWRLEVPQLGNDGLNFDHWLAVDRAVQLEHAIEPDEEFVIETRLRFDPDVLPAITDEFLAGLVVGFAQYDILEFCAGHERTVNGAQWNIFLERSGVNNILGGYEPELSAGAVIGLRIERKCDLYSFFYRADDAPTWTLAGSYRTETPPIYFGLIMKTWGDGAAFTVDFDLFDILEPQAGLPLFIRGDTDGSGVYTIGDGIQILERLFSERTAFTSMCEKTGDTDDTGFLTIGDAVILFNYLFAQGVPPAPPAGTCGVDPTPGDAIPCDEVPPACR